MQVSQEVVTTEHHDPDGSSHGGIARHAVPVPAHGVRGHAGLLRGPVASGTDDVPLWLSMHAAPIAAGLLLWITSGEVADRVLLLTSASRAKLATAGSRRLGRDEPSP